MVFDLAGQLRALTEADVRFVVIGGIAVAAHSIIRATEDLDIVPDPEATNLDRLCDVLIELEGRLLLNPARGLDAGVRDAVRHGRNLTVSTRLGDLDLVQSLPGVPSYEELAREALEVELHGARFAVCSRQHLIGMKRARGSPLDRADLERLESADG